MCVERGEVRCTVDVFFLQIGLLGLQFIWTAGATEALKNARTDRKIMAATDDHFQEILATLIEVTTKDLSKIDRTKFETLITIHLHQRDIFHALVSRHPRFPSSRFFVHQLYTYIYLSPIIL